MNEYDIDTLLSKNQLTKEERHFLKENISNIKSYLSQQDVEKIYGYKTLINAYDISRERPKQ